MTLWSVGRIRSAISELFSRVGQEIKVSPLKKKKQLLLDVIDRCHIKAEMIPLTTSEGEEMKEANEQIAKLRRVEEIKWAQRAKVKHVQEGGNNTKYFHLIASGKHRMKKIFQLEQDEGTIIGQENIKNYIAKFYKKIIWAAIH
jgi:hypothetical protein